MDHHSLRPLDPPTYTVPGFCQAHNISRSYLYQLWSNNQGPQAIKLGRRTLIPGEAAAAWRRKKLLEAAAEPVARAS